MKFTSTKSMLVKELGAVIGAVEKKTTIPILGFVKIHTEGDEVVLTATDLDVAMVTRFMARVDTQGVVCLPATKLYEIVKVANGEDIEVKIGSGLNDKAEIKSGRGKWTLPTMSASSFPEVVNPNIEFFNVPSERLAGAIQRVAFATSDQESQYTLNAVQFEISEGTVICVASNGHRIAVAECDAPSMKAVTFNGLIPKKTAAEVVRLSDSDTVIGFGFDEKQVYFRLGNRVLSSRLIAGQFPNWRFMMNAVKSEFSINVDASELLALLNRVMVMADAKEKTILLELSNGQLAASTPESENGKSFDFISIDYDGHPMTIKIRGEYVAQYLSVIDSRKCAIEIKDANSAITLRLITEDTAEKSLSVVMPLRI